MKKLTYVCTICAIVCSLQFRERFADNDKAFVITATQSNLAEIAAAKLALEKTTSDSVKAYAKMMISDHTDAQTKLTALAQQKGVTLPDSTDAEHRIFAERIKLIGGSSFDSAYKQSQVRDHVKTITLFESEVSNGNDAGVKSFATTLLPKLRMHLQMAQSLAGMHNGADSMHMNH